MIGGKHNLDATLRTISILTLVVCCSGCALLRGGPTADDVAWARSVLAQTDRVYSASVSYDGSPTEEGCAMRTMLEAPDAAKEFARLFSVAGPAGQAYAMVGICNKIQLVHAVVDGHLHV